MNGKWVNVPGMIPELVVPSLKDFHLKPYVSYRVQGVTQREFTAKDLFEQVYTSKIKEDFKKRELDSNGLPLKPSENEKLTAQEARIRAERTGTDIFKVTELEP